MNSSGFLPRQVSRAKVRQATVLVDVPVVALGATVHPRDRLFVRVRPTFAARRNTGFVIAVRPI
jgi:uncharacterized membrane protein YadS